MRLIFAIEGDERSALHLREIADRTRDPRIGLQRVRELVLMGQREAFESHGASLGEPWPALAIATIEKKGSAEPLVASGALRTSLFGGRGRRTSVTRTSVTVGTKVWYARFAKGTKHEPRRAIIGVTTRQRLEALAILLNYLIGGAE